MLVQCPARDYCIMISAAGPMKCHPCCCLIIWGVVMLPRTASRTVHVGVPFIHMALGSSMLEVLWGGSPYVHTCMHAMHEIKG